MAPQVGGLYPCVYCGRVKKCVVTIPGGAICSESCFLDYAMDPTGARQLTTPQRIRGERLSRTSATPGESDVLSTRSGNNATMFMGTTGQRARVARQSLVHKTSVQGHVCQDSGQDDRTMREPAGGTDAVTAIARLRRKEETMKLKLAKIQAKVAAEQRKLRYTQRIEPIERKRVRAHNRRAVAVSTDVPRTDQLPVYSRPPVPNKAVTYRNTVDHDDGTQMKLRHGDMWRRRSSRTRKGTDDIGEGPEPTQAVPSRCSSLRSNATLHTRRSNSRVSLAMSCASFGDMGDRGSRGRFTPRSVHSEPKGPTPAPIRRQREVEALFTPVPPPREDTNKISPFITFDPFKEANTLRDVVRTPATPGNLHKVDRSHFKSRNAHTDYVNSLWLRKREERMVEEWLTRQGRKA